MNISETEITIDDAETTRCTPMAAYLDGFETDGPQIKVAQSNDLSEIRAELN